MELHKYDEAIALCQGVLEKRYDMNSANRGGASFEKVAKVLNRIASCFAKQNKFDQAIEYYEKSLAEDNHRNTRNALRECEKEKIKFEKEAYFDAGLAEEHKEKGNAFFKDQKWVEAKAEYDEAIKRNASDAKLWGNRAAALQKLLAHPDALRDLDEAIKLDPTYVKAYSRKGLSHSFMKDFNKALKAYDDGLKIDPNDAGCQQGKRWDDSSS